MTLRSFLRCESAVVDLLPSLGSGSHVLPHGYIRYINISFCRFPGDHMAFSRRCRSRLVCAHVSASPLCAHSLVTLIDDVSMEPFARVCGYLLWLTTSVAQCMVKCCHTLSSCEVRSIMLSVARSHSRRPYESYCEPWMYKSVAF